ncbi:glycosyltransferase family 4 protein [Roseiconus lacunae]|uniref:glycosyltransferase family 4 protein n=1 Tax=Roseiconus lacunae TaxID=2605694 RepID=UPI001E512A3C|nr:glycosyltransferase [Roseiconus lacunae]MCD0460340.1 glycosyltransferase [Roseiconus lacunae]
MKVFIHSATECFTDHLPHGEGLIFYDYLDSLIARGYDFEGYSAKVSLKKELVGASIQTFESSFPLKSLHRFDYGKQINQRFREARRSGSRFDAVWRGNPFENLCPVAPSTDGLPLIVGPIFRSWPSDVRSSRIPYRPSHIASRLGARGWQQTLRKANLILSTSEELTRSFEARDDIRGRVITIPVIIERPTEIRPTIRPEGSRWQISWVGRLSPEKFPNVAIETIANLRNRGHDVHLRMAGDGALRESIETLVDKLGLTGCVDVLGAIPNKDVWKLHESCDLHLSTSKNEPYGRAILESMCAGCVPIAHNSGGPSEFLSNPEEAVLVEEHGVAAYADAISGLISHENRFKTMSQRATEAMRSYSKDSVGRRLDQEFQSLGERN